MIESLRIKGLGIIDQAHLELSPGLTVLTGETGAGKTMVLTSLRLLMGEKGGSHLVRSGHGQIEIDGVFTVPNHLKSSLEELGVEPDTDDLIVSRTVPAAGRSRGVLDGRPVPLKALADITGRLVTVHGQADQWRLRQGAVQLAMVDEFCGPSHQALLGRYEDAWETAVNQKKQLDRLHADFDRQQVEIQYLQGILDSIDSFDPAVGEEDRIDAEIDRLSNVFDLSRLVGATTGTLLTDEEDSAVADLLGAAAGNLQAAARYDADLASHSDRLLALEAEVRSLAQDLRYYQESLQEDPDQLAELHSRRAALDGLLKGRANSSEELLEWAQAARSRLEELTGEGADPGKLAAALEKTQARVLQLGEEISRGREEAAEKLSDSVNRELADLAMKSSTFRVAVRRGEPGPRGLDQVAMELQARPGGPFRPLADGVSGGELSRILLALEVVRGQVSRPGTFVFDEVDAGVGGRTATEVGRRLADLAKHQQVLVVTHLPQVAGLADRQLVVTRDGSQTKVKTVEGEDRVQEIVRMLGGEADSSAARRHALELLNLSDNWQDYVNNDERIVPGQPFEADHV